MIPGVQGIFDSYLPEKRNALEKLALVDHIRPSEM